jgi:hypothetical protein
MLYRSLITRSVLLGEEQLEFVTFVSLFLRIEFLLIYEQFTRPSLSRHTNDLIYGEGSKGTEQAVARLIGILESGGKPLHSQFSNL